MRPPVPRNDFRLLIFLLCSRIKKAYRRKALELHPDRNYGDTESATQLFAEVQSAYEVLSDPQERAWYDSHRHAFLGGDGQSDNGEYTYNTRMTNADDIYKLFSQFNPRMEFSDSETGFYGGLRKTFERIASEEKEACRWDNLEPIHYPTFGSSNDGFEDVVRPFYMVWASFTTKKSFMWRDIHRYSEAPDRRVRRIMEKENQRLREESIREFNDAVRSLVAFVKKRDPRYKANAQSEAQRQETLRQASAAQAARSRAANHAKLRDIVVPEWAKIEEVEDDTASVSETEPEYFECVACNKSFKNPKQLQAHERSKKHIKTVKQLRWEMKIQDEQFGLGSCEQHNGDIDNDIHAQRSSESENGDLAGTPPAINKAAPSEPGSGTVDNWTGGPADCQTTETIIDDFRDVNPVAGGDFSDTDYTGNADSDNDYASRESVECRLHRGIVSNRREMGSLADTTREHGSSSPVGGSCPAPKVGKAKQKRNKKAAKVAAQQPSDLSCTTCNASFSSRSQLFRHLRELDHAQIPAKVRSRGKAL